MPPSSVRTGTPEEWLRRAKSNLAKAQHAKLDEVLWEDLCFDAQQAVEKALKGVLVACQIDFPKTHDIAEILVLLDQSSEQVPEEFCQADSLTQYAVETRYPGAAEPVTEEEYHEAVALAERVVRWAEETVSRRVPE